MDLVGQVVAEVRRRAATDLSSYANDIAGRLRDGWSPQQLAAEVTAESLNGAGNRPAVLASRIRRLGPPPPQLPAKCDRCDANRMLEDDDGRPRRCPTCHPQGVRS
jgi:hypothetical protein